MGTTQLRGGSLWPEWGVTMRRNIQLGYILGIVFLLGGGGGGVASRNRY